MESINIYRDSLRLRLFELLLCLIAVVLLIVILKDYFSVQVWQHDSAIYDLQGHFHKILSEGRWLNPYIAQVGVNIGGKLSLFFCFIGLIGFFFTSIFRATHQFIYAFALTLLFLCSLPLTQQLLWPVVLAPICLALFTSSLIVTRVPMPWFYIIYGVFLFATLSSFYYLLPLCHLYRFNSVSTFKEATRLYAKFFGSWALGFTIGLITMKLVIYFFNYRVYGEGSFDLAIANWRGANPVNDWQSLAINIRTSFDYFVDHLTIFFAKPLSWFIVSIASVIFFKGHFTPARSLVLIVGVSMMLAHYILIVPLGILFELRTALATWVGLNLLIFFWPKRTRVKSAQMTFVVLAMSLVMLGQNQKSLNNYNNLTISFLDDLNSAVVNPASSYSGLLLLATEKDFIGVSENIMNSYSMEPDTIDWGNGMFRWKPIALEAGFKSVELCSDLPKEDSRCLKSRALLDSFMLVPLNSNGSTHFLGAVDGYAVVTFSHK